MIQNHLRVEFYDRVKKIVDQSDIGFLAWSERQPMDLVLWEFEEAEEVFNNHASDFDLQRAVIEAAISNIELYSRFHKKRRQYIADHYFLEPKEFEKMKTDENPEHIKSILSRIFSVNNEMFS